MKILGNKRGSLTEMLLDPAITIIIISVIFLTLMGWVHYVSSTSVFEQDFLLRDSAMMLEALYAAPGNIIKDYEENTFWFTFNFEKNKVMVEDETTAFGIMPSETKPEFYFSAREDLNLKEEKLRPIFKEEDNKEKIKQENVEKKAKLMFSKTDDEIKVSGDVNLNKLRCFKSKSSEKLQSYSILVNNEKYREEFEKNRVVISINKGKGERVAKAYIYSGSSKLKDSRALACLILNRILEREGIKGAAIITADNYGFLDERIKDNVAILVEIGNADDIELGSIRFAIEKDIKDYYAK